MSEKVDVGGYRLAVDISGREDGPWFVLSNSLGTTYRMWDPQMAMLRRHFRVLRYDTRGHGQSDAPKGPYDMDGLAGDVVALLDHYKIDRADFMGLSIGGMIGLGLAIRHGNRLNRLICADARAVATEPYKQIWRDRAVMMDQGGVPAVWPSTRDRWFVAVKPDALAEFERDFMAMSVEGLKGCGAALTGLDYHKDLGRIKTPTLYIGGEKDGGAGPDVMGAMAQETAGARYVSVPNAAHIANADNPKGFNEAIAAFLGIKAE